MAYLYKEKFGKDFVIDYVCWRKYGHNEVDEPMFTQPNMYKLIKSKKDSVELFKERLLNKNVLSQDQINALESRYTKHLNEELEKSKNFELKLSDVLDPKYKGNKTLTHKWKGMKIPETAKPDSELVTGYDLEELKKIILASVKLPEKFNVHKRLQQYFINARVSNVEKGNVDWPTAEIAAFGSLLKDGYNCRLTGEDVIRGSFSQRHIAFFDQETNEVYFPLKDKKNIDLNGRLEVHNSTLCELGDMLFEYGYSIESPKNLAIWEAQYGDFVNGAQV